VNRVFKDKPGGSSWTTWGRRRAEAGARDLHRGRGTGKTALDQGEAVAVMLEKYEVCCALFHGFDWRAWITGTPQARLALLPAAQSTCSRSRTARPAAARRH